MADKLVHVENFINGGFYNSTTTIPSYNPATGKIWARIPDSSPEVVDQAVKVMPWIVKLFICKSHPYPTY